MKTLVLIGALVAIAAPAAAEVRLAPNGALQTTLSYADLNLSAPAGADAMLARIRRAAETVCGGRPSPPDVEAVRRYQGCTRQTTDGAVSRVNAPLVTARYMDGAASAVLAAK